MAEAPELTRTTLRDGIVVEGTDARAWLQGQVSQDLESMAEEASRLTLVLSPQGKVESFCRVTALGPDKLLLDVERGYGPALSARLRRFKLRVRVTLEEVLVECEERASLGYESLGSPRIIPSLPDRAAPSSEDEDAFEAARILAGVPRLGRELTERTIPQEAGNELIDRTVSFTKGCYTGQELVARLDSRGSNVPRQIRLVRGEGSAEPGDVLEVDGSEAGQLTSVARTSEGFVGLGVVKRAALSDRPSGAVVVHQSGDRSQATISSISPPGE